MEGAAAEHERLVSSEELRRKLRSAKPRVAEVPPPGVPPEVVARRAAAATLAGVAED